MSHYDVSDFLNSVRTKYNLIKLNLDEIDYNDSEYISFLNDLCCLVKVFPDFLFFNSTIGDGLIDYISSRRFSTKSRLVIDATNNFLRLYNSTFASYNNESLHLGNFDYFRLKHFYYMRFSLYDYFEEHYVEKEKASFMERFFDFAKWKKKQDYCNAISYAKSDLLSFECADFDVIMLLLDNNVSKNNGVFNFDVNSSLSFISSVNYILGCCPVLIFSNIYGNLEFVNDMINNIYVTSDNDEIKELASILYNRIVDKMCDSVTQRKLKSSDSYIKKKV